MVTQALLMWLVIYVSFFAVAGFVLYLARAFSGRPWGNGVILRMGSLVAFLGATAFWVLLVIVD